MADEDPWAAMILGHVHELLDDLGAAAASWLSADRLFGLLPNCFWYRNRYGDVNRYE